MFRVSVVAVLLSALLAAPVSAVAETKIGVVNLRQALFSSNEARSFTEKLQSDFADEEESVREAQEEARKVKERIEKDAAMMNEEERKQLAGEFQEALKEFNYRKEKLDSAVAKRKQEFLDKARPEVDKAVKDLLDEEGLDLVLPAEAVVYVKPSMDLTNKLLQKLNE
jgi:outer membrane protein